MENIIARFLFGHFKESKVGSAVTVTSTKSLAAAVAEINGVFLQSKTALRAHTVSVYASTASAIANTSSLYDSIDIDPVRQFRN